MELVFGGVDQGAIAVAHGPALATGAPVLHFNACTASGGLHPPAGSAIMPNVVASSPLSRGHAWKAPLLCSPTPTAPVTCRFWARPSATTSGPPLSALATGKRWPSAPRTSA